ncbi:hypothetical protein FIBSPDRAFT_952438 [Athelia psychrophila]|uniref:Uncharacterized protein n=1 Tax=Athelia psychrophila TaxID=1759441 RepID=A0A166LE99_9AGAM|nr:hypothetical protein FIBSPDRAFT_952438 [Fibularhizoctonia sp. CBS 109695]
MIASQASTLTPGIISVTPGDWATLLYNEGDYDAVDPAQSLFRIWAPPGLRN